MNLSLVSKKTIPSVFTINVKPLKSNAQIRKQDSKGASQISLNA